MEFPEAIAQSMFGEEVNQIETKHIDIPYKKLIYFQ